MTDEERAEFEAARAAGLKARHETRQERAILRAEWLAQTEDTIGGWCVTLAEIPGTPASGNPPIADFATEGVARHIAEVHNTSLHETRVERAASRLPEHVRGDGPCSNCGTRNNPIWFTESVFWNAVVRVEPRLTDDAEILCIPCFIIMADKRGYRCRWRLLPEWHWETKAEAAHRHELRELAVEETP